MYHFVVLTNRNHHVLHGIVLAHADLYGFQPCQADVFSAKYNLSKVIHHESFDTEEEAQARCTQFSKWSRAKKNALIDQSNSSRRDLRADRPVRKEDL